MSERATYFGFPGPQPRYGVDRAFSRGQPSLFRRRSRVSGDSPISLAHWEIVRVLPLKLRKLFLLVLFICTNLVAQKQLSRQYGPSRSLRSKECCGDGLGPMSAKKAENLSQLGSTVMPRPPYLGKSRRLGFVHRVFMLSHTEYSGVLESPCRSLCIVLSMPNTALRSI